MIQIGILSETGDSLEDAEPFLDFTSFFALAGILSRIMELVRQREDGENGLGHDAFFAYLPFDREANEARFVEYCESVRQNFEKLERQLGASPAALLTGSKLIKPEIENYDPDIRAFMGRLVLSGEPVTPETAAVLMAASGWLMTILDRLILQYVDEDPDLTGHLQFAENVLAGVAAFCEEAIQGGRSIGFSL